MAATPEPEPDELSDDGATVTATGTGASISIMTAEQIHAAAARMSESAIGEQAMESELSQARAAPAGDIGEIQARRDRSQQEFEALLAFEESRRAACLDELAREGANRSALLDRLVLMSASTEQAMHDINFHAQLLKSYAEGLEKLARAPMIAELGTMRLASVAMREGYRDKAAALTAFVSVARDTAKKLKSIQGKIAKQSKSIKGSIRALDGELELARGSVESACRELAKLLKSSSRSADPWLAEQRYKQALRWLQAVKSAFKDGMQEAFSAVAALDCVRMEETQAVLADYLAAERVSMTHLLDTCENPRSRLADIRPRADVQEFASAAFPESRAKLVDVVADSRYLKFASTQVLKHGFLALEHGAVFSSWVTHLFVLTTFGFLHYYEDGKSPAELATQQPKDVFALVEFDIDASPAKGGPAAFELKQRVRGWFSRTRSLLVKAATPEDKADWLQAIALVTQSLQ